MTWTRRCGRSGCRRSSWTTAIAARSSTTMAWLRSTWRGPSPRRSRAVPQSSLMTSPRDGQSGPMRTLHVAVVGSGPAGLYTAEALIKQAAVLDPPHPITVDVLDRLPTPYGLVRYGVAPDHPSSKSIAEYLRGVLEHDGGRFLGGVHPGDDGT